MSEDQSLTDRQLARRAAAGDTDAFSTLYRRHVITIHRRLLRAAGDRSLADDLTAETFATALLKLHRVRANRDDSVAVWLQAIATNLYRRYLRTQRIETAARQRLGLPCDERGETSERVILRLTARELRPALRTALDGLPRDQRAVVELRIVHELPFDEIATRVGCSQLVARKRLSRALRTLSVELQGGV